MLIIIIGLTIICVGLCISTIVWRNKAHHTIKFNEENQLKNINLEKSISSKTVELNRIETSITSQNNILKSLIATAEELQNDAKHQAKKLYDHQVALFEAELESHKQELKQQLHQQLQVIQSQLDKEESKLKDLEAKQLAYIEANKRQQEIDAHQDYYRLVLSQADIDDIQLLRELQPRFSQKESIDKLIWEVYYKPAYDVLMSHLFDSVRKVCGIYKITDLTTGQAYIGQSVDIRERFRQHIKSALTYGKATNKLYQTMQKSRVYNFSFEVLEEISRTQLNEREAYWIDFYKTKEYGLNSQKGKLSV